MAYQTRDLIFSSSADSHSAGDVVAAPQEIVDWAPRPGGSAKLVSALLVDASDTGANVDLVFLRASGSIGNESAAFAPTDAVAATIEGIVNFTAWDDAANSKLAMLDGIDRVMRGADGSTSLYVGLVARGSVQPAVGDISIKLGIEW